MDDHQQLRLRVAAEYGIVLYRSYSEKEAMFLLRKGGFNREHSWFKRHRKAGDIPYVPHVGGGIAYMGFHLVDIIILGAKAVLWANTPDVSSSAESGGSADATAQPATTPSATTGTSAATSALALARQSLKSPSGN